MFTYELQRRLAAVGAPTIAVAAHPGGADTDLVRHLPRALRILSPLALPLVAQSAQMGALGQLRAATDPAVVGGQYYGPDSRFEAKGYPAVVKSSPLSHDTAIQRRLWKVSEKLTGVTFQV